MSGIQKITFGKDIPGYILGPEGRPGVIVLQEWWGITNSIKEQAEHVSKTGNYRVLVPDLYKGKLGVNAEEAHHLMSNLNWPNAVDEIKQAVTHLRKKEGCKKVGAVGFCMGGGLSLLAAEHASVDAAVSFYGTPDPRMGHPEKIKVPVQAHSGAEDSYKGFADPATVKPWIAKVRGGKGTFFEYPGEGHAFMNASTDIVENMKAAGLPIGKKESQDTAWERLFAFFQEQLG